MSKQLSGAAKRKKKKQEQAHVLATNKKIFNYLVEEKNDLDS